MVPLPVPHAGLVSDAVLQRQAVGPEELLHALELGGGTHFTEALQQGVVSGPRGSQALVRVEAAKGGAEATAYALTARHRQHPAAAGAAAPPDAVGDAAGRPRALQAVGGDALLAADAACGAPTWPHLAKVAPLRGEHPWRRTPPLTAASDNLPEAVTVATYAGMSPWLQENSGLRT